MARLGVQSVPFGGLPLPEQILIVRAARVIVAPHGAGLAHLASARRGTSVLALMPLGGRPGSRIAMAHISRMRGHGHTLWLASGCERWRIDLPVLLLGVARLCREADA